MWLASCTLLLYVVIFALADEKIISQSPEVKASNFEDGQVTRDDDSKSTVRSIISNLEKGKKMVTLASDRKIILVLGNTGAGKSTLVQLITGNNSNLISKSTSVNPNLPTDEFTIVDTENKIGNSAIFSHTEFPELVLDSETNTAMYDCPGFSDTRNPEYDISGSFYIKYILDYAEAVKFVFVINYNSVKVNNEKSDFMLLATHATNMIKNITQFKDGIAIVATKVNGNTKNNFIINNIVNFLETVKSELSKKDNKNFDVSQKENIAQFIDALLTNDTNGTRYPRIGFFRSPEEEGPLINITKMQDNKKLLKLLLRENIKYIKSHKEDFGYTISEKSQNYINELVNEINNNILSSVKNVATRVQEYYDDLVQNMLKKILSFVDSAIHVDCDLSEAESFFTKLNTGYSTILTLVKEIKKLKMPEELSTNINSSVTFLNISVTPDNIPGILTQVKYFGFLKTMCVRKFISINLLKCASLFQLVELHLHELKKRVHDNVHSIANQIEGIINSKITDSGKQIKSHFSSRENAVHNLTCISKEIMLGHDQLLKTQEVANNFTKTDECINKIIDGVNYLNVNNTDIYSASQTLSSTVKYGNYLKFLQSISNQSTTHSFKCAEGLTHVIEYLSDSQRWYYFLVRLYDSVLKCHIIRKISTYEMANIINQDQNFTNKKIMHAGFEQFLKKVYHKPLYDLEFNNIKDITYDKLKHESLTKFILNAIYKYQLNNPACSFVYPETMNITVSIRDFYDTEGYFNELISLESQYYDLHKEIPFLTFYQSCLVRINDYIKQINGTPEYEKNSKVLNYIRVAILSKIYYINHYEERYLVLNIEKYLEFIIENIKKYKEALKEMKINNIKEEYHQSLNNQITEAYKLIEDNILPEIDIILEETNDGITKLINETTYLISTVKKQKNDYIKTKEKLHDQLNLRRMAGIVQIIGSFVGLLGPLGAKFGSALSVSTSYYLTELDSQNTNNSTALPTTLPTGMSKSVTRISDLLKSKQKSFDGILHNVEQELETFLKNDSSTDIKEINDKIKSSREKLNKLKVKELNNDKLLIDTAAVEKMDTLKKEIAELTKRKTDKIKSESVKSIDEEINKIKEGKKKYPESIDEFNKKQEDLLKKRIEILENNKAKKNIKIEKTLNQINHVQTAVSVGEGIYDYKNRMQNYDNTIIKNDLMIFEADEKLKKLNEYESKIYTIIMPMVNKMVNLRETSKNDLQKRSHSSLDVRKWEIQSSIKDVQIQMRELTEGFEIQANLKRCFEKFEYGMATMIQIFDRIQDAFEKEKLADYIANMNSNNEIITEDRKLESYIVKLELTIKSNLVLQEYGQAIDAFKQYIFPFANKYLNQFDLSYTYNNNSDLINKAVTQIQSLKTQLMVREALINPNEDKDKYSNVVFNSNENQGPGAFLVWKYDIYHEEISKLLKNQSIIINADIARGIEHNAVKFNEISLNFKLFNKSSIDNEGLQKELDKKLSKFKVEMIHLGDSYYRCGNKTYIITHNPQTFNHYVTLNHEGTYSNANVLTDKIQKNVPILSPYTMWKIKLICVYCDPLTKFENQSIDLELVGKGEYVNAGSEVCNDNLETHYKIISST